MSARKSDDFISDVERQFEWYAVNAGWDIAEHYLASVEAACHLLAQHPRLGPCAGFSHPRLRDWRWLLKKRRAQLVHHGQRDKVEQLKRWPSWNEFRKHNRLPAILVDWWVRSGTNGAPGLMFFRSGALTKFLKVHLDQSNLDSQAVKKFVNSLG